MLTEKVVRLETETSKVYDQIQRFLKKKEYKSENTRLAYEKDIKRFIEVMRPKVGEIQYLTREDIQFTLEDFEDFIEHMHDKTELNNKTINRCIVTMRGLLNYLNSKKFNENLKFVDDVSFLKQIERLPENDNRYGVLQVNEVLKMAELARQEREKGEIKRLLILFCLDTCVRLSASLNVKWTDFEERDDYVIVKVVDKGNKDLRPKISKEFYKELQTIKSSSANVFPIDKKSVDRMMGRLRDKMNLNERNIVFHSIKKAGVSWQYRISGSLLQAKKAAHHSNVNTTLLYIEDEEFGVTGAVSVGKNNYDEDLFKKVSHEELLKGIENLNKDQRMLLNIKLKEVIDKK